MTGQQRITERHESTDIINTISNRRSIRSYEPDSVTLNQIHKLLTAAVQAPNATRKAAWEFAIIQDKALLETLSNEIKSAMNENIRALIPALSEDPDFNIFYNAGTLIIIYSLHSEPFATADCWLAAENLMLAAYSLGLGSCVIGTAITTLNSPQWKNRLGVPQDRTAIAPIIVGIPEEGKNTTPKKRPEIIVWKK